MSHELTALFAAGVAYLALLFLIAYATESGLVPARWVRHPWVYVLSLGVYATSWSFYGSVGFAARQGYLFLTIYLGVTAAFLLAPLLLRPLQRLVHDYQLISLADLFAFRYRSQLAGALVTLFMLLGALPYIALQIRAVTESLRVLTDEAAPQILALVFCATLTLFAILFGARHISPREKHQGLVVAIAFESLVKLVALLAVGGFALFGVMDGPGGLGRWLNAHPEALERLYAPVREGPWGTLMLLSFAAAFLLPRQFHMIFTEGMDDRHLQTAAWGLPLYLLLLNLAIPPVLWAGQALGLTLDPDYFVLGVTLGHAPDGLALLAFIGGVSAASAMVIVSTLALSAMCLNHLLLPASYPDPALDLYRWLLWGRRMLIALIIFAGFGFYALLRHRQGLVQLGLISFVAVAQFLPGIVGVLWWRRATRTGFLGGLAGGIGVWAVTLLWPLLATSGLARHAPDVAAWEAALGWDHWTFATFWSLCLNGLLFVGLSLATRPDPGERQAALACCSDPWPPLAGTVSARSPREFQQDLGAVLGEATAGREVDLALRDLGLTPDETRPAQLRRLRERIERNLSGLIGPQLAHVIVSRRLRLEPGQEGALADSMRFLEERLERSRDRLRGLSADLDRLRRYHRRILQELPLGVCALDDEGRVLIWNGVLARLSGISPADAGGRALEDLAAPWGGLLGGFLRSGQHHAHHLRVELDARPRWFNLHQARVADPDAALGGQVILAEDITDLENLEAEIAHSDRLASIGRLAAGVAHEIGNPVTAIASLAQNLREETTEEAAVRASEAILHQTRRITAIVRALTGFSRGGESRPRRVPLQQVVAEALDLVRLTPRGKRLEILQHVPPGLTVTADRQALAQMLVNLLTNACDASPADGRVEIMAWEEAGQVQIEVLDQGPGIAPERQSLVFEPFYTTKPAGEGTGLGLAMVYRIVEAHGGDIRIDSEVGTGTRFLVRLPV